MTLEVSANELLKMIAALPDPHDPSVDRVWRFHVVEHRGIPQPCDIPKNPTDLVAVHSVWFKLRDTIRSDGLPAREWVYMGESP